MVSGAEPCPSAARITLRKLGKYEIIRELGRGAMGVVFKARDPVIGRLVALKTITAGVADIADLLQRFYREAQAAGGLQHPNVVTVYEMGEAAGAPFIAMEYLEGESLEQLIARRPPLPLAQRVGYLVQACRALDYAHRRGIVHRDIKPGNIMVTTEGMVKVVDFGIARLVDTSKTQTGVLLGTLGYMSPQQLRGKRADERSDIWSVGAMFYELLTYEKPFTGENHAALLLSIVSDEPRPIGELAPDCPAELQALVHRALRKDDAERFQTMEELLSGLEPLWKRLQSATVDQLVAGSRRLIHNGRLPEARELLRQALLIDTSSAPARTLLEEVNAALKATLLPAELQERVNKGTSLLEEGLLEEARAQAEAALELDPGYEPARQLLERVERETQRRRQEKTRQRAFVGRTIRVMRAAIESGDLAGAIELGRETLVKVGDDTGLTQLLAFAERELNLREHREELDRQLRGVHSLLEARRFEEAEAQLTKIQENAPLDPRVQALLEAAREKQVPSAPLPPAPPEPAREYVFERASSLSATPQHSEEIPLVAAQEATTRRSAHRPAVKSGSGSGAPQAARTASAGQTQPGTTPRPATLTARQAAGVPLVVSGAEPPVVSEVEPLWKRPLALALLGLVLIVAVGVPVYRRIAPIPTRSAVLAPGGTAPATLPPSLEDRQRSLIALAHEAADRNDYKSAQAKLNEAEEVAGPLHPLIQDLRRRFAQEEQNADIRGIAQTERDLWTQATNQLNQNRLDQAENTFRQILELPEGGRRKADAQRFISEVLPRRRDEERLFAQAQQAQQRGDPASLRQALQALAQVIAYAGPRRQQAEQLHTAVREKLDRIEQASQQEQQIAALVSGARQDLQRGDILAARLKANQIRQRGGDPAELTGELHRAEQTKFAQLEALYRQDAPRGDETARQQLRDLQPQFRAIADGGGPLAANARNYADNLVPSAVKEVENRMARASSEAAEAARFNEAVEHFTQAVEARDASALKTRVLPEFQRIARGEGPHARDARAYETELVPQKIAALAQGSAKPTIGCPPSLRGLGQNITAGAVIACGLLDPPQVKWVQFSWPEFPQRAKQAGQQKGLAMLSITLDENGNVSEVVPRGKADPHGFYDAAAAAARNWKTNPPRAQSKPVKTSISVDIPFSQ